MHGVTMKGGMAFGFRKTATAAIKPDRQTDFVIVIILTIYSNFVLIPEPLYKSKELWSLHLMDQFYTVL